MYILDRITKQIYIDLNMAFTGTMEGNYMKFPRFVIIIALNSHLVGILAARIAYKYKTNAFTLQAYGGLRGAVAFSLVAMLDRNHVEHKAMFETTTLVVVLFTVFIQVRLFLFSMIPYLLLSTDLLPVK